MRRTLGTVALIVGALTISLRADEPPASIQVWGDVQKARVLRATVPELVVSPKYEGKTFVVIEVWLDGNGKVQSTRILSGSPFAGMNEKAVEAIKKWSFAPATVEGRAVRSVASFTVRFKFAAQEH
jgi:TonB family protein